MTDWTAIRAAVDAGGSMRSVARDHGISDTAIRKRAKAENWPEPANQRRKPRTPANPKPRTSPSTFDATKGLTPQQRLFVAEYLIDRNATQAAIRAGYSEASATTNGPRLRENAGIAAAIDAGLKAASDRSDITADRVIKELAKIGFANMQDYMTAGADGTPRLDFAQLTRDQAAALSEVTVDEYVVGGGESARDVRKIKFKLADKRAALRDLGDHFGIFANKAGRDDGSGGAVIQVIGGLPDGETD